MERSDDELIAACRDGQLEHFDALYTRYVAAIHGYLSRRTLSREIAEDLTSITFLKALEGIRSFNPSKGNVRGWLYRIARNALIDHYRDPSRRSAPIESAWDLPGEEFATLRLERSLNAEKLRASLQTLNASQREIVLLRVWDDLSYAEIAQLTGKSEASCKMTFSRAVAALRADMAALLLLLLFPRIL